ncbi:MAG TPA: SprT-like domain-containing protein [Longimicrobiaceae bacterium]|nr:SprT-like domain-containing protein [Longimicrobiaceae bacterium]
MSWKDALLDLFGYTPPPEPSRPAPRGRRTAAHRTGAPVHPAAAASRTSSEMLAVVRAAGGSFRRVVFTQNRRVMASVAEGGQTLRLNVAFADAPDGVLGAVSVLFTTRDGRTRNKARETVRRYIHAIPAPTAPPARRQRRVHPGDVAHIARLQAEFDRVNAEMLDGSLPRVPLYLSGLMRRRNGHFSAHPLEIVISRRLCTHGEPGEAELTLRHEMVHLWQHATERPVDHGLDFRRMARRLDVHPRATRPVKWKSG